MSEKEDREKFQDRIAAEEKFYKQLEITTNLENMIKEEQETSIMDEKSRKYLLKWLGNTKEITRFDAFDTLYVRLPSAVEDYKDTLKEDNGFNPLCMNIKCFCKHDESKDKLRNYNGGVLGPVNFARYLNNCSQIARKCDECGKKHPGHEHIKCKKYNELSEELYNWGSYLENTYMLGCPQGTYEEVSALAYKIIKKLLEKL